MTPRYKVEAHSMYFEPIQPLFASGTIIKRDEFLKRVDMAGDVPYFVKMFWHIAQFEEVVIDEIGQLTLDGTNAQVGADE